MAIAIPDTVLEEHDALRDKTMKLGSIARACATYGVDFVEVFDDPKGRSESKLIKKILEYLETPQYLRKRIYPLDEDLKFAGLLPPLRTPSHKSKVSTEALRIGEIREGITNPDGTVDIGLDQAARLREKSTPNRRVTVRVTGKNPLTGVVIPREEVKEYWGYCVESRKVDDVLGDARFEIKIATSRLGDPLQNQLPLMREALARTSSVMFIFGAPSRGLFDMVGKSLKLKVDFVTNLFAEQHVETVRTEEAVYAGLNLLNVLSTSASEERGH